LRADRAHELGVDTPGLIAGPADLAGVVGGEEAADDELAGLMSRTSLPTSSTTPTYSCPIGSVR
jgi:hypothetical protein